jgi:AraC family transcriptional regulator
LAEIAIALEEALSRRREDGEPGRTLPRVIARGRGWTVADVVCTCGPSDRPYEERHAGYTIAVVLAGSFQYRSATGHALMTPGSLMLGNQGQCFECGHEHGEGDRCVSFWYAPWRFERLAADAGVRGPVRLPVPRLPSLRSLAPLVARAGLGVAGTADIPWEELAATLAAQTIRLAAGAPPDSGGLPRNAEARVSRAVRTIADDRHEQLTLETLADAAGLSPYHFLRTFERLTGVTPHQYVLRARLRKAAMWLAGGSERITDVAFDCGFGDVSNFNRAFRREFGMSPRAFRRALG